MLPANTSAYLWGAFGGAVIVAVVGFSWGGWTTAGTAQRNASTAAHDAVVAALAPICADRFQGQTDAAARTADLAKTSTWERGAVIEESGFATMPGAKSADVDVARACAAILANPPTPKT
jgi:hypothetical protein